jgi:hypothetical protein
LYNTKTIGFVKELQTVANYDNVMIQDNINNNDYTHNKKQERQPRRQWNLKLSNTTPTTDAEDLDHKHSYRHFRQRLQLQK